MKKTLLILIVFLTASFHIYSQNRPVVQDIQAVVSKGTKVNVFWTLPQNPEPAIDRLLLYRDTRPVSSFSQLSGSVLIAELPPQTSLYTDSLEDFNEYYYTVIAVTTDGRPYDVIFVSMNSTVDGVQLKVPETKDIEPKKKDEEKLYTDGTMRETPLPFISYVEGQGEQALVSDETAGKVMQLSGSTSKNGKNPVSPYFFEEDLISPDSGDDFLLFEVLKTTFVQEKYDEAIILLNKLNGTNISDSVRNRVNFYIAQAYFFTGDFEQAAMYFAKTAQSYPLQTKIWMNYTLDRIALPE